MYKNVFAVVAIHIKKFVTFPLFVKPRPFHSNGKKLKVGEMLLRLKRVCKYTYNKGFHKIAYWKQFNKEI